jgi:8-oxo-dGTP pyrophosphatase MutT (NUDIX family)
MWRRPNGERWDYHIVHLARIAVTLLLNEETDEVLMLWRYRFATDQWGHELLGGRVDEDEESAATAAREAPEESGLAPVVSAPEDLISFEAPSGQPDCPGGRVRVARVRARGRAHGHRGGRPGRVGAARADDGACSAGRAAGRGDARPAAVLIASRSAMSGGQHEAGESS